MIGWGGEPRGGKDRGRKGVEERRSRKKRLGKMKGEENILKWMRGEGA